VCYEGFLWRILAITINGTDLLVMWICSSYRDGWIRLFVVREDEDPEGALVLRSEWFCGARHFCNIAADCRRPGGCENVFASSALDEKQVLLWDVGSVDPTAEGPPQSCDFTVRIDTASIGLPKPGGMVTCLLLCAVESGPGAGGGDGAGRFVLYVGLEGGQVAQLDSRDLQRVAAVAALPDGQPVLSLDMDWRRGVLVAGSSGGAIYSMRFPPISPTASGSPSRSTTVPVVATALPAPGKFLH
jgi:hypothetical protein